MSLFQKIFLAIGTIVSLFGLTTVSALAHVIVTPEEVNIAKFQTFTVSVPNENEADVVAIRLLIPSGVKSVTPTVKAGWTIQTKKEGDEISEISWTAGAIPAERRDDFSFSAQAPGEATILPWKAYQTYSDGTVVTWDQPPAADEADSETSGPYSETKVINDLAPTDTQLLSASQQVTKWAAYAALVISAIAIVLALRKKPIQTK